MVDQFTLTVLGDSAGWSSVDPPVLSLFPGAEGTATLTFAPPKLGTIAAGPLPFGVRVVSQEDPQGSTVEEGTLDVAPFADTFAELIPRTSRGSRTGKHELAIDNRGNVAISVDVRASDPDEILRFRVDPPSIAAAPGTAVFVRVRARPKKRFLRGQPKTIPFEVAVLPQDDIPVTATATMLQEPLIPKWLPRAIAALAALALLWALVLRPTVESAARNAVDKPLQAAQQQIKDLAKKVGATPPPPITGGGGAAVPIESSVDERLAGSVVAGDTFVSAGKYSVAAGSTLSVTDILLENPQADSGFLRIQRGAKVLLEVALDNFRDLDYHFVTPILIPGKSSLELFVKCVKAGPPAQACRPAAYFSGTLAKK